MNRLKDKIKKKWKTMAGMTVMLMFVFVVGFAAKAHFTSRAADDDRDYVVLDSTGRQMTSGQEYTMRRKQDQLSASGAQDSNTTYTWQSLDATKLKIGSTPGSYSAEVTTTGINSTLYTQAVQYGTVGLTLTITENINGTNVSKTFTFTINIMFSVNEYLVKSTGVEMNKIFDTDERKAIIMDYHGKTETKLEFGTDATDSMQSQKLNLMFGDATKGSWNTSNKDVVKIDGNCIVATGPGKAKLTVTYQDTDMTKSDTDEIWVYVRPEVIYQSGDGTGTGNGKIVNSDVYTQSLVVKTGDYLDCQAKFDSNPNESISQKLIWVISKEVGGNTGKKVLIKDSLGNTGSEDKDDAELVWYPALKKYQLKAKAETYVVQFFVADTYPGFENLEVSTGKKYHCDPVNIAGGVQVKTNYEEKNVTINIGGHYDLTDAFNISLKGLTQNFNGKIYTDVSAGIDGSKIIDFDTASWNITTKSTGKATLTVTKNPQQSANTNIPEYDTLQTVKVNITVMQTFSMNVSSIDMAIGASEQLYGTFGEDVTTETSQFKWEPSDDSNEYITVKPNGQYATIVAKKETPANTPVLVTLSWTSPDGVTLTTKCNVTVRKSVEEFHMVPDTLTIEQGQQSIIATDLTEKRNLIWLSSDPSVGTIEQISGTTNPSAMFTALKAGKTVITALNPDNNVYATCEITVTQPVTELAIGVVDQETKEVVQYDTYTTTLAEKYVFMKAIFGPSDTTEKETDFKWSVEGTFSTRGETISIINLARCLGMKEETDTSKDMFLVTNFNGLLSGFHVNGVVGIHRVNWSQIIKPDSMINNAKTGVTTGIINIDDKLVILIDFEKIVADITPDVGINLKDIDGLGDRRKNNQPIIYAEDSQLLSTLIYDGLSKAGYTRILPTNNGLELWNILQKYKEEGTVKENVACVVTDIEMPQMDGHRLLKLIKNDPDLKDIPVIIFSSLINEEMRKKGESLGADAPLSKNDIGEFIKKLDEILAKKAEEENENK